MANILVVDDYIDAVESMTWWLEHFGHDVQIARDGRQALEVAARRPPDCVLLDLGLTGVDGYEVASRLRREVDRPLVIIAITGHDREPARRRALAAGCDHFFIKPFKPRDLLALLPAPDAGPDSSPDGPPPEATAARVAPSPGRRQVGVVNILGLHLRAADRFVRLAREFRADVWVSCDGRMASGKSILDLATLAAGYGTRLELEADGPDAEAALDALTGLIERGFNEQPQ